MKCAGLNENVEFSLAVECVFELADSFVCFSVLGGFIVVGLCSFLEMVDDVG